MSHITIDQLRSALPAGIRAVSNIYNLVDRTDGDMLTLSEEQGIVWAPYFPLGGGFGSMPKVGDDPVVQDIAAATGTTTNQVGLSWLLTHSPSSLVIAATSSIAHLDENIGPTTLRLPGDAMSRLDARGGAGETTR